MAEERVYTETELEQELLKREVQALKATQSSHIQDEQKQWQKQNAKTDNIEQMVRQLPNQIVDCRRSMESDIRNEFMPRKEVELMEERLDARIDEIPKAIGLQIDNVASELKAANNRVVARVTGIMVGVSATVAMVGFILKLTGHV